MSALKSPPPASRRSGGRDARRAKRLARIHYMLATLENKLPPIELLSAEQLDRLHEASMTILEEVGIDFRDPIALGQWREAGAEVDGQRVRPDRELVMELVRTVPAHITLHARNPECSVEVGGNRAIFVPMTGAPYLCDLDNVRRAPMLDDLANFHKLSHMLPALHSSAHHIVEPMDLPVAHRHLHITYSSIRHSDKTFMGMTTSGKNAEDVMRMCRILFGEEYMESHPVVTGNINANSPLVWDQVMLSALRAFSSHNQPVLCSPFVMAGANTPASVAPAVAQLNAEALSGLAYTQIVRRGAPAIYGHYLSTVSMKSGAPMAGTPEISLMNAIIGQLARHYRVPWRTSNTLGGSKLFDAQAGYESATTLMAVLAANANYIWHSAGWNEAGMHCSTAKFVVDAEQCAMGHRFASGINWEDFDEALAAVRDIGPGGHYLGHPHTLGHFADAFFAPELFDNSSIEQWQAEGAKDTTRRALEYARKLLAEYEYPPLDPAVDEALLDFIRRREREIPASNELNQSY